MEKARKIEPVIRGLEDSLEPETTTELALRIGPFLTSLDAMIVMDSSGMIIEFNPAAERIFGYKRQEVIGKPLADVIIPPKYRAAHRRGLARYLREGSGEYIDQRVEVSSIRKNGEEFPVELYITRVSNQSPPIFMGTIRDISHRREADSAVKDNEQRWLALLENSSDGIALVDTRGKMLFASNAAAGILGYTPKELLAIKDVAKLTHPDDRAKSQHRFARLAKSGASASVTYRARAKDGSYRWLTVVAKNATSNPNINGIIVNFRDVTSWRQARDDLEASERRYRFVVQNSSDIVTVFDREGIITYQSPSITRLLGLKDVRVGSSIFTSPLVHPDDLAAKNRFLGQLARSKPETEMTCEFRMLRLDGSWRNLEVIGVNLLHVPDVGGVILSSRDVTERRLTEAQRDEFIAIASHELKTPVTSMKTYAAMLERKFRRNGEKVAAEAIHAIDEQLNRLKDLIHDLLDASRAEAGQLKFSKEVFDYSELIKEAIGTMRLTTNHHTFRESGASCPIKINSDRSRLLQVLTNLLENAIKYSPDGGPINLSVRQTKTELITCISDKGLGIPKDRQAHLFERFARVGDRRTRDFPGLGLGLYITARIVDQMGGEIRVDSDIGRGAEFYFSLPIAKLR